jgi:CRISPR/Cas system-associated endonuclease Cas3-HD
MAGKLSNFIGETKDVEERKKLWKKYHELNKQIEKIAHEEFEENDFFYRNTIENITDTERVIKKFKENQINLVNLMVHLIDIIANVEKILLGWKITNEKNT